MLKGKKILYKVSAEGQRIIVEIAFDMSHIFEAIWCLDGERYELLDCDSGQIIARG